LAYSFIVTKL